MRLMSALVPNGRLELLLTGSKIIRLVCFKGDRLKFSPNSFLVLFFLNRPPPKNKPSKRPVRFVRLLGKNIYHKKTHLKAELKQSERNTVLD